MKTKDNFLDISYRLRLIKRFSIRSVHNQSNTADHSWFVAVLALYIAKRVNSLSVYWPTYNMESLLTKALMHDVPESITSDIVHFIKHFDDEMSKKIKGIEEVVVDGPLTYGMDDNLKDIFKNGMLNSKDDTPEGKLVGICDLLDIMAYLSNERSSGNVQRWLDEAFDGCHKLLKIVVEDVGEDTKLVVEEIIENYTDLFGLIKLPDNSDLVGVSYDKKAAGHVEERREDRLRSVSRDTKKTGISSSGPNKSKRKGPVGQSKSRV